MSIPEPYEKIARRAMRNAAESVGDDDWVKARCDSPIEELLLCALWAEIKFGCHEHTMLLAPPKGDFKIPSRESLGMADEPLVIFSQVEIEKFRVDFVIATKCGNSHAFLVVECDGHDFHERTKKQAAKDRSRDRRLQELGYTVFRFTGSELWRDPCGCADQIIDWSVNKLCWG